MERGCIIVAGMIKIVRDLTWRSQVSWISNDFQITVEIMNISLCVYFCLTIFSRNVTRSIILGATNNVSFALFNNDFMYWIRSLVGEKFSPERFIYCLSLRILSWKTTGFLLAWMPRWTINTVHHHLSLLYDWLYHW